MSIEQNQNTYFPFNIPSLDKVLGGGVQAGSTVLIISEPGAGAAEFVQTATLSYYYSKKEGRTLSPRTVHPASVNYVSPMLSKDMILLRMSEQFNIDMFEIEEDFSEYIQFVDLGESYFDNSSVPSSWYRRGSAAESMLNPPKSDDYGGLTILLDLIAEFPQRSVVVVDTLTAYLPYCTSSPEAWLQFLMMMRGLARACKEWGTSIFFLLTENVLSSGQQAELSECFDGVFKLYWQKGTVQARQRQMYVEKFSGLLPTLDPKDVVVFNVNISTNGFEITNMRMVS